MIRILVAVCLIFVAVSVRADIAPTQYVGYGISPVKAKGLRMLSAHVDITWGNPCTLSATFVIDNQSPKAADIQLGFPIQRVYSRSQNGYTPDELTFAFDGVPVLPASIAINDPITEKLKSLPINNVMVNDWDDARFVQYLNDESKEVDPEHKGIKFVLRTPADKTEPRRKLAGGLQGGDFAQLLQLENFKYSIEGGTVYLEPTSYYGEDIHDPDEYTWYRCQHTFLPGQTKVSVATKFPASLTYAWPYRERILYCIETGGSWEGTIGSEEVDIHFPNAMASGQIYDAKPKDYAVDGNTVRWLFKDFKPKGKDHDIDIEYLRPDVVAAIAKARAGLAHDPFDPKRIIELAKDLFSLGPYKGYAPYAPDKLSLKELNGLLAHIKNDPDQVLFRSFYALSSTGEYELSDDQWQKHFPEILRILNSIDYQPTYGQSPDVTEARGLIERLLQDHPDNAEAWNVYFANYYRFRFAGGGRVYYPHEIAQITKAASDCPNDPSLQLWFKVITGNYSGPNNTGLQLDGIIAPEQIVKQGILDNDFPKIDYVGY